LRAALGHRWITLGLAIAPFVASISTVAMIPTSFLSTGSQKIVVITVSPPPGADIQAVARP
jgi:multidrug efflux pump subunit AcrB